MNYLLILGLNGGVTGAGHDPAACLIEDGKILSAIEEERFVGIKHAYGLCPLNAIKYCLKENNLKITDIDKIAFYLSPRPFDLIRRANIMRPYTLGGSFRVYRAIKYGIKNFLQHNFRINPDITFVEHHVSHASSSFFLSGFNKANIITMDAAGERTCTMLSVGNGSEIEILKRFYIPNSWGYLYTAVTEFLGYQQGDEGTTMALASFGNPNEYDFFKSGIVKLTDDGYKIHSIYHIEQYSQNYITDDMMKIFGNPRLTGEITEKHKDIAASLQVALEKTIVHLAKWLYEQTGYKKLCLAGGNALNCKMNGVLLQQDFVDDIFIQPASNDAGTALGCAIKTAVDSGYKFEKMRHAYLGSQATNEEIENTLKVAKVNYERIDDIAGTVAQLLANDKIVGWVQGRMEIGPRALGARSILANPKNPKMKDILNFYVKHREPFRPFCPSLTAEAAKDYFEGKLTDSPFMILSFDVKDEVINRIPAVVHVDKTARPQFVEKNINPLYYEMINQFGKLTGDPMVLNTSFNDKGQPIIRTPEQAIKMFYGTGMDCLVMGNFLLKK